MKRLLVMLALGAGTALAQNPTVAPSLQPAAPPAKETNVTVVIETSEGTIVAELYADKAPVSVANFLAYADEKFFDGTIFHRVIPDFMIQGGGFTKQMRQKATKPPIKNEAGNGLTNDRGTLAMARTALIDSATAQFFINHKDNAFLNHKNDTPQGFGYAVFGKVTGGMDVVDKIAAVATGTIGPFQNVPQTPVEIKSIRRKTAAAAVPVPAPAAAPAATPPAAAPAVATPPAASTAPVQ